MKTKLCGLLILFCLVLSGCATNMRDTPDEIKFMAKDEGIVVGSVAMYAMPFAPGEDQSTGWFKPLASNQATHRLVFRQQVFMTNPIELMMRPGAEEYFVKKLPAGKYHFNGLTVGNLILRYGETFQVEPGKTTYIGRHGFVLPARLTLGARTFSNKSNEIEVARSAIAAKYPDVARNLVLAEGDLKYYEDNKTKDAVYKLMETVARRTGATSTQPSPTPTNPATSAK